MFWVCFPSSHFCSVLCFFTYVHLCNFLKICWLSSSNPITDISIYFSNYTQSMNTCLCYLQQKETSWPTFQICVRFICIIHVMVSASERHPPWPRCLQVCWLLRVAVQCPTAGSQCKALLRMCLIFSHFFWCIIFACLCNVHKILLIYKYYLVRLRVFSEGSWK